MKNRKNNEPIDFSILKAPGSYFDTISDLNDFQAMMDEADKAANKLLKETSAGTSSEPDSKKVSDADVKEPTLEELLAQLDELIGLEKIKANVHSLINLVKVRKLREDAGLPVPPMSLHLVFMGNPGTGKTTVARLIAKLYHAIGVLSKGQLIETDRSGLVAGYVGQTAIKTSEVIKSALGGVLFIDEAYSLAPTDNPGTDFGHEAIETILKAMEDNRDDLVVIVAGYEELMEHFISSNPGLESRFNRYFLFEDYTGSELNAIFNGLCSKNGYTLTEDAAKAAEAHFNYLYDTRDDNFGNGRDVRNFFENIVSIHADRVAALSSPSVDDLKTITTNDVSKAAEM